MTTIYCLVLVDSENKLSFLVLTSPKEKKNHKRLVKEQKKTDFIFTVEAPGLGLAMPAIVESTQKKIKKRFKNN